MNRIYTGEFSGERFIACQSCAPSNIGPYENFMAGSYTNQECESCRHDSGKDVWGWGHPHDAL